MARIQRNESGVAEYRVVMNFLCAAPGERSVCLPAAGSSYTQQQIEAALRPVLAPQVQVAQIELTSDGTRVLVRGRASEADARAALERVRTQLPWLEGSSASMGKDEFSARLSHGVHGAAPQPGHLHHGRRRALSTAVLAWRNWRERRHGPEPPTPAHNCPQCTQNAGFGSKQPHVQPLIAPIAIKTIAHWQACDCSPGRMPLRWRAARHPPPP
ncbi:MAG: hypothetical protein HEQ37_14860 [Acidovorax sp.]|nr:hypothetical protein [Acidovorax sp.]